MDKSEIGLFNKFTVTRNDGKDAPGEKHDGCEYFVLDLTHDPFAAAAISAYAHACREKYPALARDLCNKANRILMAQLAGRFPLSPTQETGGERE